MTRPKHNPSPSIPWPAKLVHNPNGLLPGASRDSLEKVEQRLGRPLPEDLKTFLQWRDGGLFANQRFIIYSAGDGIHPQETLIASNEGVSEDYPLVNIARDDMYQFGIKKDDLDKAAYGIYAYVQDFGTLDKCADSLRDFIHWMEGIGNGQGT